jgi:hypothetical protein
MSRVRSHECPANIDLSRCHGCTPLRATSTLSAAPVRLEPEACNLLLATCNGPGSWLRPTINPQLPNHQPPLLHFVALHVALLLHFEIVIKPLQTGPLLNLLHLLHSESPWRGEKHFRAVPATRRSTFDPPVLQSAPDEGGSALRKSPDKWRFSTSGWHRMTPQVAGRRRSSELF